MGGLFSVRAFVVAVVDCGKALHLHSIFRVCCAENQRMLGGGLLLSAGVLALAVGGQIRPCSGGCCRRRCWLAGFWWVRMMTGDGVVVM